MRYAYQRSMPFTDRRLTSQMIIGVRSLSATGIFLGPQSELFPLLMPLQSVGTNPQLRAPTQVRRSLKLLDS